MVHGMDVAIVGAGLAGLATAVDLTDAGHTVQVFESADRAGGRVHTDEIDGHLVDLGFQIMLAAYPDAWELLDEQALDMKYFVAGASIRYDGAFHRVSDPLRELTVSGAKNLVSTATAPIGSLSDKARIIAFRNAVRKGTIAELWARPETTARQRLEAAGFGDKIIDRLLQPLFAGITLDPELSGSSRVLEFIFRMLSAGSSGVPAKGMAAIPEQLVNRLPDGALRLSTPVNNVAPRSITTADETVTADAVVVATDQTMAADLCGLPDTGWRQTTTLWMAADESPVDEPILMLNGDGSGPINTVAVMSQMAPAYAPPGSATIAISAPMVEAGLADGLQGQLRQWFGPVVEHWRVLRVDEIHQAHPIQAIGHDRSGLATVVGDDGDILVCGDHRTDPSINGAIASGRAAAARLIGQADARAA